MNNPIDLLWVEWNANNIREIPAVNIAYRVFSLEEDNKKNDVFYNAVTDSEEVAFKAGFRTALKLFEGD